MVAGQDASTAVFDGNARCAEVALFAIMVIYEPCVSIVTGGIFVSTASDGQHVGSARVEAFASMGT